MKRNFKIIAYSKATNEKISEYVLQRVTEVKGIGFKQKVTVQETDTVDYVVKQVLQKKTIKLQVHFLGPEGYAQADTFNNWLGAYVNLNLFKLTLQYTSGYSERLVDIYIEDYELNGQEAGDTPVDLQIKPLSPSYIRSNKIVTISNSNSNKQYPYSYPYVYGGGSLLDGTIENNFIASIPLRITLRGKIVNPTVSLEDKDGNIYATIRFNGMTIASGQKLVVDGINQRITLYASEEATEGVDYFNEIDKTLDTFLMAKPGQSTIVANLDQNEPTNPSVEISYIEYIV